MIQRAPGPMEPVTSPAAPSGQTPHSGAYSRRECFEGYVRPDDRVGIRNHVLILGINGLVASAAGHIAAGVRNTIVVASPYGRGQFGADKALHDVQMAGIVSNPNVAAALLVAADRMTAEGIVQRVADCGKPIEIVALDDVHEDAVSLIERGIRIAAHLAHQACTLRRERIPLAKLFMAVECGHSDATSGMIANPLAGQVVDRVVSAGGTCVVGETLEWLGAEHLIAARATNPAVSKAILEAVNDRERAVAATGMDLTGNNPCMENIRGGLSSIEEKSLGAMAKSGSSPICGLLAMAQAPTQCGLHLMDTPAFSPESLTCFVAAGAQLILFTTGPGNSYCSQIAPTIKISAHPDTTRRLKQQIDFDASAAFHQGAALADLSEGLLAHVRDVCSGTLTWGEILHQGGESIVRVGASF